MANYYGSSFADKLTGLKNADNTFSFDSGEFSSVDTITGGSDSAYIDTIELTGVGQWGLREDIILSAADFGTIANIEWIDLATNANTSITLPDAIVATTNTPDGSIHIEGATGDDMIDASLVTSGGIVVNGSNGNDTLIGGSGDDVLTGGVDDDVLEGGLGKDSLIGLSGVDIASGTAAELDGDSFNNVDEITVLSSGALTIYQSGGATEIALAAGGNDLTFSGFANVTGGAGNDAITANNVADFSLRLHGNGGNDTITASLGDDTLTGGTGADILSGWSGDDTLNGGQDGDLLIGGSGNDSYKYVGKGDIIFELSNGGTDSIETALTAATLPTNVENLTYTGKADFTATGNGSNNVITARNGDDTLDGSGGSDTLNGNSGNDTIHGGNQSDTINGGSGADALYGEGSSDWIDGGDGSDTIVGGSGNDTADYSTAEKGIDADLKRAGSEVITKAGTDHLTGIENLVGTDHDDVLKGNGADNILTASFGDDTIWGLGGDDILDSAPGIDEFHPGSGNDTAYGDYGDTVDYTDIKHAITATLDTTTLIGVVHGADAGDDVLNDIDGIVGGAGNDTISFFTHAGGGKGDDWFEAGDEGSAIDGGEGFDTVYYDTSGPYVQLLTVDLLDRTKNAGLALGDTLASVEAVTSGDGQDSLYGDDADNRLSGGGNIDLLDGRLGNDTLDGGGFTDLLYGGDDFDTADYSTSYAAVGIDLVVNVQQGGDAFGDFTDSIEGIIGSAYNDSISGSGVDNAFTGGAGDDSLSGLDGGDTLDGGAGDDTMLGGTGDDYYIIDSATDTVDETGGSGIDTVETTVTYTLLADFEYLVLGGSDSIDGIGNAANNHLTGNAADNVLNGLAGQDSMTGGDGDDTYYINAAADSANELADAGVDTIRASITATIAVNVENLVMTGSNSINGAGNGANNAMTGNGGGNVMDGLGGADTINAAAGADTVGFSTALGPDNIDTITAFSASDDTFQLDNAIFTGLATGTLASSAFVTGAAAADATDRIIYDSSSGALLFDADGTGAAAAVQFAILPTALTLTNLDFVVI